MLHKRGTGARTRAWEWEWCEYVSLCVRVRAPIVLVRGVSGSAGRVRCEDRQQSIDQTKPCSRGNRPAASASWRTRAYETRRPRSAVPLQFRSTSPRCGSGYTAWAGYAANLFSTPGLLVSCSAHIARAASSLLSSQPRPLIQGPSVSSLSTHSLDFPSHSLTHLNSSIRPPALPYPTHSPPSRGATLLSHHFITDAPAHGFLHFSRAKKNLALFQTMACPLHTAAFWFRYPSVTT